MNILVTGANGQLGREMRMAGVENTKGTGGMADSYVYTDIMPADGLETEILDITDAEAVRKTVKEKNIRCIVNCAAYTNVDKAETDEALCRRLNADAPRILAEVMKDVGGLLVQISTDYVFGADPYNTPCREDQEGTPTGVYGRTKLEGEQRIIAAGCDHVIIRTAWLYSEYGKNFVKTMLDLTATRPQVKVVFDQTGTPTYAYDLAKAIMAVLSDYESERGRRRNEAGENKALKQDGTQEMSVCNGGGFQYSRTGIYHYSNEGVCSWYDFTKMIAEYSGHTGCDIQPCHSDEFPSPVKRPAYSVLDKTKIKETFGLKIPYWTDSLKRCLSNLPGQE